MRGVFSPGSGRRLLEDELASSSNPIDEDLDRANKLWEVDAICICELRIYV